MTPWAGLAPQFTWRPSQRHLLELAGHATDQRWHLCAPPGAGKTLIGLELARRVDRPTLALSPTTAIRDQWRASTARFGADPERFTSADPVADVPLRCVTYQLLGNPGEAADELRAAGRRLWVAEVQGADLEPAAAEARVRATEEGDAKRAGREIGRHVRALRRSLGTGEDVGLPRAQLLGPRTTALVDALVASGLGCVVLDECHHLLDWWALVVSALIERLAAGPEGVAVIGLTATLPEPSSQQEAANYEGLLGGVDAELHLAAMVAEGAIAPWRDGVRVVPPASDEAAFLDHWQAELVTALDELLAGDALIGWAVAQIVDPTERDRWLEPHPTPSGPSGSSLETSTSPAWSQNEGSGVGPAVPDLSSLQVIPAGEAGAWQAFWDRDPLAAAAVARWWAVRGLSLPSGFDPPPEAAGPLTLADRLGLLDAWLHDPEGNAGADERTEVDHVAGRFGLSFTTAGVRWGRSVGDLVCARSSAKGDAAAEILVAERRRRGDALRALVVVERDQATTPPAAARAVLGEDSGTAARVLARLIGRTDLADLGVLAVTGRGAWAGAADADRICAAVNVDPELSGGGQRLVRTLGCDIAGAVQLVGDGPGWTPARWLAAAEAALDDGAASVLVATRGLVGEGWDHPPLNVLVDLSEVASAGAVTQLRGRALRIDQQQPDKLASLWDVAVVHPAVATDWARFRRRHARWWGPDASGAVVTGPSKVHPRAGVADPPDPVAMTTVNAESDAAVADIDATRAAWRAVDPGGVGTSAVRMRRSPGRRRHVRTRGRRWRLAVGGAGAGATVGLVAAAGALTVPFLWPVAAVGAAGALAGWLGSRGRQRDEDSTFEALADAVLAGLVAAGHADLARGTVSVTEDPSGELVATVVGVQDDAAETWAGALAEALGPVGTPRWLLAAPGGATWRVPAAVGATKAAAEAFTHRFRARVPGAHLVRAGTPEATALVLTAARERPDVLERTLRWH